MTSLGEHTAESIAERRPWRGQFVENVGFPEAGLERSWQHKATPCGDVPATFNAKISSRFTILSRYRSQGLRRLAIC
jgi:hypothetical protein